MIAAQLRRVASREERRVDAELSLREYVDYLFSQPPLELPRGLLNIEEPDTAPGVMLRAGGFG